MFVVPSRSRPQNIQRLAAAAGSSPFLLMLDADDPMLGAYMDMVLPWQVQVNERMPLSAIYNKALADFPNLDWYGVFADDVMPRSPFWASQLIVAAGDDGMAYGDDGIASPSHFVLGGALVREMGWLAFPGLHRLYMDTIWADIARARGVLRYLPDVLVTHMHPSVGLGMRDATHHKQNKDQDRALYADFKRSYNNGGL